MDAAGGVRTHDLRIKSPLLYQLSYSGGPCMIAHSAGGQAHPDRGEAVRRWAGARGLARPAPDRSQGDGRSAGEGHGLDLDQHPRIDEA
jgi:hypothetical protein